MSESGEERLLAAILDGASKSSRGYFSLPPPCGPVVLGMDRNPAYVYVIGPPHQHTPIIKVGMSRDCEKRLRSLQTGSPVELAVLHYVRLKDRGLAKQIERDFHFKMRHLRSHGEWFKMPLENAISELGELVRRNGEA